MKDSMTYVLNRSEYDRIVDFVNNNKDIFIPYLEGHSDLEAEVIAGLFLIGKIDLDTRKATYHINKLHFKSNAPELFVDFIQDELGVELDDH